RLPGEVVFVVDDTADYQQHDREGGYDQKPPVEEALGDFLYDDEAEQRGGEGWSVERPTRVDYCFVADGGGPKRAQPAPPPTNPSRSAALRVLLSSAPSVSRNVAWASSSNARASARMSSARRPAGPASERAMSTSTAPRSLSTSATWRCAGG